MKKNKSNTKNATNTPSIDVVSANTVKPRKTGLSLFMFSFGAATLAAKQALGLWLLGGAYVYTGWAVMAAAFIAGFALWANGKYVKKRFTSVFISFALIFGFLLGVYFASKIDVASGAAAAIEDVRISGLDKINEMSCNDKKKAVIVIADRIKKDGIKPDATRLSYLVDAMIEITYNKKEKCAPDWGYVYSEFFADEAAAKWPKWPEYNRNIVINSTWINRADGCFIEGHLNGNENKALCLLEDTSKKWVPNIK